MTSEEYIEKINPEDGNVTFKTLMKEGIKFIQELSGKHWTDFNTHDPGITILEQLCYAITELQYKSNFEVKDFLAEDDGTLDLKSLALYEPHLVFPSAPVTIKDYRKLLFDKTADISDLWITPSKDEKYNGLYSILVQPRGKYRNDELKSKQIVEQVTAHYCKNRNLGEDLKEVRITNSIDVLLHAHIEVSNKVSPEDILVDIYFMIQQCLNTGIKFHSFESIANSGKSIEEILCGPLLEHGVIKDEELVNKSDSFFISDFVKIINKINGIISISELFIEIDNTPYYDKYILPDTDSILSLIIPDLNRLAKVGLYSNNRKHKIDLIAVQNKFWKKMANRWAIYNSKQDVSHLYKPIKGEKRDFEYYYSIQHQFPNIYGVNKFGVPKNYLDSDTEAKKREAQARQLKSYLLFFEQILANFLSQLSHVKDLFSIDPEVKQSYYSQSLHDVPSVKELYKTAKDDPFAEQKIADISAHIDNFYDRRSRFLDYLLALYGESFSQHSLKRFNYYYQEEEFEQQLLDNKIAFLKHIVTISKNRFTSYNYLDKAGDYKNISGLKLKIFIILGIRDLRQVSYSDAFLKHGLKLVSSEKFNSNNELISNSYIKNTAINKQYIEQNFNDIPNLSGELTFSYDDTIDLIKQIDLLHQNVITDTFLRYGVNLKSFKIGQYRGSDNYIVCFLLPHTEEWLYVSSFKDEKTAHVLINKLRLCLIQLNVESEGVHFVEHILLRPETANKQDDELFGFSILDNDGHVFMKSTEPMTNDECEEEMESVAHNIQNTSLYKLKKEADDKFYLYFKSSTQMLCTKGYEDVEEASMEATNVIDNFTSSADHSNTNSYLRKFSCLNLGPKIPDDFYSFKVSAVFPNWTSRFNNDNFKLLAEETLSRNAPAHLKMECYWLDPEDFNQFEMLYLNWLNEKATRDSESLETIRMALIEFLLSHEKSKKSFI